jgi:hypothetical protein
VLFLKPPKASMDVMVWFSGPQSLAARANSGWFLQNHTRRRQLVGWIKIYLTVQLIKLYRLTEARAKKL